MKGQPMRAVGCGRRLALQQGFQARKVPKWERHALRCYSNSPNYPGATEGSVPFVPCETEWRRSRWGLGDTQRSLLSEASRGGLGT